MLQEVDEGVLGGWAFSGDAVDDILHAVLFEDLEGVVAEAGIEVFELAFGGGVGAELEYVVLCCRAGAAYVAQAKDAADADGEENHLFHFGNSPFGIFIIVIIMRPLLLFLFMMPVLAQRTATVCGADGNANTCTMVETSRIGNLRFEDYRVTNPAAPLVNLDVRRAHLGQIPLGNRNLICTVNPNAAAILSAPTFRFSSVISQVNEIESLVSGQLNQEVFAQTTVRDLVMSDGFSIPQFVFRISRSRGTTQLLFTMNPSYQPNGVTIPEYTSTHVLAVDSVTGRVSFPTELPSNTQVLRIYWAIAVGLPGLLNERAEIKAVDPTPFGRPLFSAEEVRGFAAAISRAVLNYASPTIAPVLDASCVKGPFQACSAQDALESFGEVLSRNGAEYLATGAATPARIIGGNLANWAKSGALANTTLANLTIVLKPLTLLWPTLERESFVAADRTVITNWLRGFYGTVAGSITLPDYRGLEAASILMMDSIQRSDDAGFALSVERYFIGLQQMRADGSMPLEVQRGACALNYSNRAVASLVTIAESAAAQGYDLYSLKVNGRSLDTAIEFLLDGYDNGALVARYNNPSAECELGNVALDRRALDLSGASSSPAAWIEIYLARFPNSALSNRLKSRVGLTGFAKRPLSHFSAAANTTCLFLTPQELSPISLPLLDAFVGNQQSGATRAVLSERLGARVRTASGVPVPNVLVQFAVSDGAATVEPASALTDPFGVAYARLKLGARSGVIRVTATAVGASPVVFTAAARGDDPKLATGGVVGVGGSVPSVKSAAPGSILSLYGADFVPAGMGRRATLRDGRLPTVLEGICVYFGTTPAFMLDAYPTQLNVIVPALTGASVEVRVAKNCGAPNEERTDPQTVAVRVAAPEFFFFDATVSGNNPVAAVDSVTQQFLGPLTLFEGNAKPAKPGDFVTLYLTGLGATTPAVAPGAIALGQATLRGNLELRLAGQVVAASNILYAGFSPGSLIYQINFRVPAGLPASNQPISVTVDGQTTPVGGYLTLSLR